MKKTSNGWNKSILGQAWKKNTLNTLWNGQLRLIMMSLTGSCNTSDVMPKVLPSSYVVDKVSPAGLDGIILTFDNLDKIFNPQTDDNLILVSPDNSIVLMTSVKGIERPATLSESRWSTCGIWIDKTDINFYGWLAIILAKPKGEV